MYKDKDRQREANRQASKRYRLRCKGMTPGMTYCEPKPESVIPSSDIPVIPEQSASPTQSYNPMMVGYVPPEG